MSRHTAIQKAVKALGGQTATARTLAVSQSLVWQWLQGKRPVAPKHCSVLEAETGVRCEHLRDDVVFTRDPSGAVTGYHVRINH
jgi:DNA-binding transcriptional regulator YdaS (Cro superfamily)